jgi:putative peptidoglycan lipid II flippase
MSSNPRSFVTTNAIVVFTLLIGFANNVAIAALFGLTRRVDAYYAAQVLPNLFMVLCIDYLGKNFLPMFAKARKEGPKEASELASSVVTMASLLSLCVALILSAASPLLFRLMLPGFDAAGLVFVQHDFWIMAPSIVLMTITAFNQYVCQHDEDYMRITAIRASLPVANLAAILIASPLIGEYALPVGWLAGQIVVFFLMTKHAKYRYSFRISIRREWELKIFSNSAIVMSSGLIARSRILVANYLASLLGGGAISALAMSGRITDPLGRTIFMTVRLMMFSQAARFAVNRESHEIARLYHIGLGAGFLLLAPLLWWMGLNAHVLVQVLFMRGEFDVRMVALVSVALIGAVPSVLFSDVNAIMSNAFYALGRVLVPALVMPLGTVIYCLFAVPLSTRYGIIGMTASVSASGLIVFVVMTLFLSRQLAHFSAVRMLGCLGRYAALAGVAVGLAVGGFSALGLAEKPAAVLSLICGTGLYGLLLLAFQDPVLAIVGRFARRALPARSTAPDAPFQGP